MQASQLFSLLRKKLVIQNPAPRSTFKKNIRAIHGFIKLIDQFFLSFLPSFWNLGLGTQQFTVLALHDQWVELTPRANLRHFPDLARGYLMWFYYNGFLHFAGINIRYY